MCTYLYGILYDGLNLTKRWRLSLVWMRYNVYNVDFYIYLLFGANQRWFRPAFRRNIILPRYSFDLFQPFSHWGRVTHICVVKITSINSDNGLVPGRRQALILTNVGILLIGPFETNFSETLNHNSNISIDEYTFGNVVCEIAAIFSRAQFVKSFPCTMDYVYALLYFARVLYSATVRYTSA